MKLRKGFTLIFLLLILAAAVVPMGSRVNEDESIDYARLISKAKSQGFVRVIIKMDVPDIHSLTAQSNRFNTGNEDISYAQRALEADLDLEENISTRAEQILHKLNGKGYHINHTYSTIPYLALDVSLEALITLKKQTEVLSIIEDKPSPLPETWREDAASEISQPQLNASRKIVGAEDAWSLGYTGKGWYVAILDTGFRKSHEFFAGKNSVEQCFSVLKDCPNGQSSMSGPGAAAHLEDRFDHGTQVTGIVLGNNKKNIYGIAKDADIIAVQIFSYIPEWDDVGSYYSDQVKGLEFVYQIRNQYKIASVNMSFGGLDQYHTPCDAENESQKDALDNLKAVGIAPVAAAGNQVGGESICAGITDPACISSAVSVGATTPEDTEARFSYYSSALLDLFAPGQGIVSSAGNNDTSYESGSGTSMATPHVAGAWAILKQFNANLSVNNALKALKENGTLIKSRCGSSKPRINIGTTIMSLLSLAPPLDFTGEQQVNRSLLQTEYINILTWKVNPINEQNNQNILHYRIYTVAGADSLTFLVEVDASTFEFWHRMIPRDTVYRYAIKSVNDKGEQSIAAYVTVE